MVYPPLLLSKEEGSKARKGYNIRVLIGMDVAFSSLYWYESNYEHMNRYCNNEGSTGALIVTAFFVAGIEITDIAGYVGRLYCV